MQKIARDFVNPACWSPTSCLVPSQFHYSFFSPKVGVGVIFVAVVGPGIPTWHLLLREQVSVISRCRQCDGVMNPRQTLVGIPLFFFEEPTFCSHSAFTVAHMHSHQHGAHSGACRQTPHSSHPIPQRSGERSRNLHTTRVNSTAETKERAREPQALTSGYSRREVVGHR